MIERKDPYKVLGVARDADAKAIQKRFRKLAREHHPDLHPDDAQAEARFKDISEAHRILGDPEMRALYDEFGDMALEPGFDAKSARQARDAFGANFARHSGPSESGFHMGGLEGLFGELFGRQGSDSRSFSMRGQDLEAELELDFAEAAFGGERSLTLSRPIRGAHPVPETIKVRIPPGVDSGGRLRIPGKGAAGIGDGPAGDLWVTLRVRPHRIFQRDGANLNLEVPIGVVEAIRGAEIEVPTLDGRVKLTIPPGTHSGTRLRLKGKGVPRAKGGARGDLFVRVQIRVPQKLDDAESAALDVLAANPDEQIRAHLFS